MLDWLRRRFDRSRTAGQLYGSIVTQARHAAFYADLGVPDSTQGRFEMIVLHLVLVVRRLSGDGGDGRLGRALTERFVIDMDDSMREMAIGDLAVPREIKQATAALLDRNRDYAAALAEPGEARLEQALASQLAYLDAAAVDTPALAAYVRAAAGMLDAEPARRLRDGIVIWPEPRAARPAPPAAT